MNANNIRAELFAALESLSEAVPEMRAGQLMAAIGELCADLHGRVLWEATDSEFLEAVWQFQRNFEAAVVPGRQDAERTDRPDRRSRSAVTVG